MHTSDDTTLPPGLSVVIPVYNSAECLPRLLEDLCPTLDATGREWELILVNDGSRDQSWEAIQALQAKEGRIRGFDLMRNFGQHNALLCGIQAARFDTTLTMDDDLQHPPEEIPRMLATFEEGWDVVYGTPVAAEHSFLRGMASSFTKIALKSAMGADTARMVSAFRVFLTQVRDGFDAYRNQYVCIDVLLTYGASRFTAIQVEHRPRAVGETNYSVAKLFAHALNMITGYSSIPLQIASMIGFMFTLFGVGLLVLVLTRYIIHGVQVPGFAFLASIIVIFSGAQMFALGIIGEYLARIHSRAMERPAYLVRERK